MDFWREERIKQRLQEDRIHEYQQNVSIKYELQIGDTNTKQRRKF